MRTEGEFNAFLSKEFRKFPKTMVIKTADKYRAGLSDFIMWSDGRMACVEVKFVTARPQNTQKLLLKHGFSPEQLTFLKRSNIAGSRCFGLVGIKPDKYMYLIRFDDLEENFSLDYLLERSISLPMTKEGVDRMCDFLIGEDYS